MCLKGTIPFFCHLVWLNPGSLSVRSVRVFDSRDRLVRIYEDFAYRQDAPLPRLTGFRVTSLPTESHTVFRVEELSVGEN